jgi:hypothetical protein
MGAKDIKKPIGGKEKMIKIIKIFIIIIIVLAFSCMTIACKGAARSEEGGQVMGRERPPLLQSDDKGNKIFGEISDTVPQQEGHIMIGNVGNFTFDADKIKTVRDDIFNEGFFSIFDIMVYLDDEGKIEMEYHFDESMNTYIIDSLNGMRNWWHISYYDGGWPELNVFRMDHYPYKDKMYISVSETGEDQLESYYKVFREEVERREKNGGKIIIPELRISTPGSGFLLFENVEIKSHNLRSDIFKEGAITAIDAIMTLGDEGEIIYDLNWYESIGTAGLVKDYFVDGINDDISIGRCGFVYEEGSFTFAGFQGNHIHIPSDTRLINSPEYLEFFWICI